VDEPRARIECRTVRGDAEVLALLRTHGRLARD
jgi:hypothetical protein